MCIFSQPVESVNDTKIFARKTKKGAQYLVYQMNYSSVGTNAMILPIPTTRYVTEEKGFQFIDLSNYESFFDDLAQGFPYVAPKVGFCCSSDQKSDSLSNLAVYKVGSYVASFVPSLSEFERLDPRFVLPKETWDKVPEYENYSFVVFQLSEGEARPHPMAFRFDSKLKDIYFPTMHIHDGEVHEREAFDHTLYLQHAWLDSQVSSYVNHHVADSMTDLVRSKFPANQFCQIEDSLGIVLPDLLVHKKILVGQLENCDYLVPVQGDPIDAVANFRRIHAYMPWAVVGGATAWFFHRRNRVKEEERERYQ